MKIEKPIFVIGSGRSGTSIFYNIFARHPDLCWFSNYSNKYIDNRMAILVNRLIDIPLFGTIMKDMFISRMNYFVKPAEAGRIYHEYCGFKYNRKSYMSDINVKTELRFKNIIRKHILVTGKCRFLSKQTANTQRLQLIDMMFPDAYFIHVIRDGRAASNSMLNVDWWYNNQVWWLGKNAREWEKSGKEPIELCALNWKRNVEEIMKYKVAFKERYIEIKYEEFVHDVRQALSNIAKHCELNNMKWLYHRIPRKLPNMNYKWRQELSETQIKILDSTLKPFLNEIGYY